MNRQSMYNLSSRLYGLSRMQFLNLAGVAGAVALLGAVSLLTACGSSGGDPTTPAGDQVQLVYQDWRTDWFPPWSKR